MANAWELMPQSSWFGSSWTCDCGPYIGPWAVIIAPVWLPLDAGEVDFYIGKPNPNGKTVDFADESYPSGPVYDAFRYGQGAHDFSDDGGVPNPGAHLFVTWYNLTFDDIDPNVRPSVDPLGLVSRTQVAGGHGPVRIGAHWSDYMTTDPMIVLTDLSSPGAGDGLGFKNIGVGGDVRSGNPPNPSHGFPDDSIPAVYARLLNAMQKRTTYDISGSKLVEDAPGSWSYEEAFSFTVDPHVLPGSGFAIHTLRASVPWFPNFTLGYFLEVQIQDQLNGILFDSSNTKSARPLESQLLSSLPPDTPYGTNPDTGETIQFENSESRFIEWLDYTNDWFGGYYVQAAIIDPAEGLTATGISPHGTGISLPSSVAFDVVKLPHGYNPTVPSDNGPGFYPHDFDIGEVLRTYVIEGDIVLDDTYLSPTMGYASEIANLSGFAEGFSLYDGESSKVDLSSVPPSQSEVWIYFRPRLLKPSEPPTPHSREYPTPTNTGPVDAFAANNSSFMNMGCSFYPNPFTGFHGASVRVQPPRWRYWNVGVLVFGEHALRLAQRDDGLSGTGMAPPRLGGHHATSVQSHSTPRLGAAPNTYA